MSHDKNGNSTVLLDASQKDTAEYLTGTQFVIEILNGMTCLALLVLMALALLLLAPPSVY